MNPTSQNKNDILTQLRSRLSGKSIAIIGGDLRQEQASRIKREFQLANVIWIPTRSSDPSPRRFKQVISRQEVGLVVALHGLLRHQHIHDLHELCRRHAVPMVACWRSLNSSSLSVAVLNQLPQFRPEMLRRVDAA